MTIKTEIQASTVREWIAPLQSALSSLYEMEVDASGDTKLFLKVVIAAILTTTKKLEKKKEGLENNY